MLPGSQIFVVEGGTNVHIVGSGHSPRTYSSGHIARTFPSRTIPPLFSRGVGHFPLPPPPSANLQYKAIYR